MSHLWTAAAGRVVQEVSGRRGITGGSVLVIQVTLKSDCRRLRHRLQQGIYIITSVYKRQGLLLLLPVTIPLCGRNKTLAGENETHSIYCLSRKAKPVTSPSHGPSPQQHMAAHMLHHHPMDTGGCLLMTSGDTLHSSSLVPSRDRQ
jgi:hypothetical protein